MPSPITPRPTPPLPVGVPLTASTPQAPGGSGYAPPSTPDFSRITALPTHIREQVERLPDDELAAVQAALAEPLPSDAPPIGEDTIMDLYLTTRLRNRTMADSAVARLPTKSAPLVHAAVVRQAVVYYRTHHDPKKPITRDMVTGWIHTAIADAQAQRGSVLRDDLRKLALPETICAALALWVTGLMRGQSGVFGEVQRWLDTHCTTDGSLAQACQHLGTDTVKDLFTSAHGMSVSDFVALLATAARHGLTNTPEDSTALFATWDAQHPEQLVYHIWEPVIRRELKIACGSWEHPPSDGLLHAALGAALHTYRIWQLRETHITQMIAAVVERQRRARAEDSSGRQHTEPASDDAEATADVAAALSAEQIALARQDWGTYNQGGAARATLLTELAAAYPTIPPKAIATLTTHIHETFRRNMALSRDHYGPRVRYHLQQITEILQTLQAVLTEDVGIVLQKGLSHRIHWDELAPAVADTVVEAYAADPIHVIPQLGKRLYHLRWFFAALITLADMTDERTESDTHAVELPPMLPDAAIIEHRFGQGAYWAAQAFLLESQPTADLSKKALKDRRREIGQALCDVMARPGKTAARGFQTLVGMTAAHLASVRNAVARQRKPGKASTTVGVLVADPATAKLADAAHLESPERQHDPRRHASVPQQASARPAALAMASAWFETPPATPLDSMHTATVGDLPAALLDRSLAALQRLLLWGVAQPALQSTADRINAALRAAFPNLVRQPAEAVTFETAPLIRNHLRTVLLEQLVERVERGNLPADDIVDRLVQDEIGYMRSLLSLALPIAKQGQKWSQKTTTARNRKQHGNPAKAVSVTYTRGRPYSWVAGFYDPSYRGTVTVGDVRRYVEVQVETYIAANESGRFDVASVLMAPGTRRIFPGAATPADIRAIQTRMGPDGVPGLFSEI